MKGSERRRARENGTPRVLPIPGDGMTPEEGYWISP